MVQAEQISTGKQNELARLYPYWFDQVPDDIPAPLLFGADDYTIEEQNALEDLLALKGQSVQATHQRGITFDKQTVLSAAWVQSRYRKIQAARNFSERKQAGAVRPGALGIVGNNLDTCNTETCSKRTRAGLFRAQNMIQKIRLDGQPLVSKNVCQCGKPLGKTVELQRNREHGSGSINGVQTCGSVWACPVCRNKIISERAEELKEIFQQWTHRGGHLFMITLTVPHSRGDNLAELYGSNATGTGISGALAKFRESRDFSKRFKERTGYFGDVRGVEVTWGWKNGFHPHIHMLVLTENTFCFKEWKSRLHKVWARACLQAGLQEPSWERGVVISKCNTSAQAQYLAKWSAASELVSQGMKIAKSGNFSIAELERCLWDPSYRGIRQMSMTKAATILRAYYGAMKGQRMLQTGGIGPDGSWKSELLDGQEEQSTESHEKVCHLKYTAYIKIKRSGRLPDLLEALESGQTRHECRRKVRQWLETNGFTPDDMKNPYPPNPPPLAFSYQTGFEETFFADQKVLQQRSLT